MILFVKRRSVSELVPALALAKGHIDLGVAGTKGSVNLVLPDVQSRIEGILSLLAGAALTPPNVPGMIANLLSMLEGLTALLALPLPAISGLEQIAALQQAVADLLAELANLQNALTVIAPAIGFSLQMTSILDAGFVAYGYQGAVADMGGELAGAIGGGQTGGFQASDQIVAITLAAAVANPADRAALNFVFGV